jgi:transcription initiation factor TFIIIB Brf1 subunit/transcription initiation factor TFIIB
MWRHITGVEPPAKKNKLDNNEKLERKRTYDQIKRNRKFQTSWQKNRNWLVHNSEIDRMTCSVCIPYASSDRMMVTLVMMMFHVMTILTFFLHCSFFK